MPSMKSSGRMFALAAHRRNREDTLRLRHVKHDVELIEDVGPNQPIGLAPNEANEFLGGQWTSRVQGK